MEATTRLGVTYCERMSPELFGPLMDGTFVQAELASEPFCHYGDVACPSPTFGSVGQYICITDIRVLQEVFRIDVTIIRAVKTRPCIFIRSLHVIVVLAYCIDIFREHSFQCNRQRERNRQLVIQS